ncbi:penicillin-binding protein 2 [Dialister sp.]|uniref:penicillin-binding protein 2 n=1 Tax=Dialister sp. TaxID=1955814 RepID=UPI002E820DE1|nr:penicillin-binding protein 2 [Dialister sp.]MEE3451951.1 penicillin-binding protein 2 [Dialister sp.]
MKRHVPSILGSLVKDKEESRYVRMIYAAIILLLVLGIRLFWMQIIEGSYYRNEADGNRIRHLPQLASRGVMYDRNGVILAGSRPAYSIIMPVDRKKNSLDEEELTRLSSMLNKSKDDLKKKIEDNKLAFGAIYLANDVGIDVATLIEEKKDEFPGIEIEVNPLRVYPMGAAGAQILGYVGEAGPDDRDAEGNPYKTATLIGRSGLERQYNQFLEGKNGTRTIEVNASGQPVRYVDGEAAVSGNNIRLTLDAHLQQVAEDAIDRQARNLAAAGVFTTGASAVAIDPNTGAILAMVSWPSYDPNKFSKGISSADWKQIIENKNHPMQNRTISAMYPPGSLFKVITGAAALESKVTTPTERIFDSGKHWLVDKRNSEGEAFGWINFYDAIQKSDNVYFYEMGRRLGIDRISAMAEEFGLGRATGIDLSGEADGNVASEQYKLKVFHQDWYLGETMDAAIGQSFNLTTPIQMAMVYASIANGGFRYRPYLVNRIDKLDGTPLKIYSPEQTGTLPVSKTTLDDIHKALRMVMTKDGTGGLLFSDYPVPIAGKSGTAETNGLDNGWFVAYAPFDKPEIVVLCMFEHSGFGSESAAPVVKQIMNAYFHLGDFAPAKNQDTKTSKNGGKE